MENKKKLLTKILEYAGVPSLKHQALLKVTVLLWNHESILYEPWKSFDDTARRCLGQKSSLVEYRINTLPLPVLLKNELSRFNAGIYLEIFKWNEYQLDKYGLEIIIPKPLCWKLSGTINYKKTAEF
ncbi:hypothetical protein TNIN_172611 [Trichonephila inaurata madagascariensis]|uniref:Uncharacterized protein n=1 Tax=Trichonephila inaurata madagascariensis TaxID=2747483 RepID=A0A8X6WTK3_9ARAC|nr:hypothetical protein TNIN_172611 [Trichonephila inaurata madagascariensis]